MDREKYAAKYRDPRWQKMRLEVLSRDEFACQFCFDHESTLHVHHRWYKDGAEPWEYPLEALLTLCETCHEDETNALPQSVRSLSLVLKQAGAISADFNELAFKISQSNTASLFQGTPDAWTLLAHGIYELIQARAERAQQWTDLRDRWYELRRQYLAEQEAEKKK